MDTERRGAIAGWIGVMLVLAVWAARRLDAFNLWTIVVTANGERVRFPNGLAVVDHPFHATRAETLRRALADGDLLRWIGHHQGGYPVEFYPLGVAWLDLAVWGAALGSLPMMAVHKLVVIGIFLIPAIGFALLARGDRLTLGAAAVAYAAHLSVRGWWWSGGGMELVEWGLVTNVAAATALLLALPCVVGYCRDAHRRVGAIGAVLCAFALVTNPRSGIALAAMFAATTIVLALDRVDLWSLGRRIAGVAAIAGLMAAPEIIALLRYNDLYFFVRYSGYADLRAYWESSVQAVGGPVFVLGLTGLLLATLPGSGVMTRVVAVTTAIYAGITASIVLGFGPASLIDQLETTRLMPFQRFLWLYLAATAVVWLVRAISARITNDGSPLRAGLTGLVCIAIPLLYVVSPPSFVPEGDRGLVRLPGSAQPGIVDLNAAVTSADGAAAPGTALLVLGTTLSWHDQLWSPMWSDRPFFYDDWLWYWQQKHAGQYDPRTEHAYRSDESALEPTYLAEHGIGAVIVTGRAKATARLDPDLTLIRSGVWDVYRVNAPVTIITFGDAAPESSSIEGQRFSATGVAAGGIVTIRRNWFPRWRAEVNGNDARITQSDDGYMSVQVPPGEEVTLSVAYGTDWIDWGARLLSLAGLIAAFALVLPARLFRRARSEPPS